MSSALSYLCKNLKENTDKLEEEINNNIADCHKLLIDNKATHIKLSLEKAKDYHYKEVLEILKEIVSNIRKLIYHEKKIRKIDELDESSITPDELKRYSYVQRQVQAFSTPEEVVTKREKRRVASSISVESLEAWELYLDKKEEEEKAIQVEMSKIPKREAKGNRKKKKFVSSTFNNFLDTKCCKSLDSILEEQTSVSDRLTRVDSDEDCTKSCNLEFVNMNGIYDQFENPTERVAASSLSLIYESCSDIDSFRDACSEDGTSEKQNLSTLDILESLNQEYCLEEPVLDTKPKIVDVVVSVNYKKKEN